MNNKSVFWAGVAVMAGLVFFGAMIPTAVKVWRSTDRTVAVKGLCEREVPADKVIWPITIKVVGNDLADTYAELDRKNDIIAGFLADGGIAADNITFNSMPGFLNAMHHPLTINLILGTAKRNEPNICHLFFLQDIIRIE